MIFKIKDKENIYEIDDLISFDKQSSGFREAFQKAIKENKSSNDVAEFDNAQVSIFNSNRVIITIKDIDNENI